MTRVIRHVRQSNQNIGEKNLDFDAFFTAIDAGARFNSKHVIEYFHEALKEGRLDLVYALEERGFDFNDTKYIGGNILLVVCDLDNPSPASVKYICSKNQGNPSTALEIVLLKSKNLECLNVLLNANRFPDHHLPYHLRLCIESGFVEGAERLMQHMDIQVGVDFVSNSIRGLDHNDRAEKTKMFQGILRSFKNAIETPVSGVPAKLKYEDLFSSNKGEPSLFIKLKAQNKLHFILHEKQDIQILSGIKSLLNHAQKKKYDIDNIISRAKISKQSQQNILLKPTIKRRPKNRR